MNSVLSRRAALGLAAVSAAAIGLYGISRDRVPSQPASSDNPPLSASELSMIAVMAEGIIPQTDTPGAIGAKVPEFIASIFAHWFDPAEQIGFRDALQSWQAECRAQFGTSFERCTAEQQTSMLNRWDAEAAAARAAKDSEMPPFARFKALTVFGYYSSAEGQGDELKSEMTAGQDSPHGPAMESGVARLGGLI